MVNGRGRGLSRQACRFEDRGRPPARRPPRSPSGARGDDRYRSGRVTVRQPRVRDREADATDPDRIRFSPSILPPYMRRSKSIETLLPILYLKGISTGDFSEALAALLGKDAAGLSASAIDCLKDGWLDEHTAWQKRDLSAKRYVYIWADGIHLQARLEDEKQCILVLIGATPEGRKELVGFTDGARESAHDWRDLLLDLKRRGLDAPPGSSSPMAHSGSGSRRRGLAENARAALLGAQAPRTCSPSCQRASSRKPSARCKRSGWPKPRPPPSSRSTLSWRATR
jgi:hypothetical protein